MSTRFALLLCAALAAPAAACDYPDEGNLPLRRAVSRIRYLPEIDAWSKARHDAGELVQYQLFLEHSVTINGRCYWTIDVRGGNALWRRYYVTPDGKRIKRAT